MRLSQGTRIKANHHVSRRSVVEVDVRNWEAHGKVYVQIAPLAILEMRPEEFDVLAGAFAAFQSQREARAAKPAAAAPGKG